MVSGRVFIFHIYIPWFDSLSLVPKSRLSVKVKYQGHSFKKYGRCGGISVSQTQLVYVRFLKSQHCAANTFIKEPYCISIKLSKSVCPINSLPHNPNF